MKFLCVRCDEAMALRGVEGPDGGSMSIVYGCPSCGARMAMLTNPQETQMVRSLGVRIGTQSPGGAEDKAPGCPFGKMVEEMAAETDAGEIPWTEPALRRLEGIPEFVRPMARQGVEKFARDRGYCQVDEKVLDEARGFFGM